MYVIFLHSKDAKRKHLPADKRQLLRRLRGGTKVTVIRRDPDNKVKSGLRKIPLAGESVLILSWIVPSMTLYNEASCLKLCANPDSLLFPITLINKIYDSKIYHPPELTAMEYKRNAYAVIFIGQYIPIQMPRAKHKSHITQVSVDSHKNAVHV